MIKEIKTLKKLWRDRKYNCLDIFDQIIESSGKKEKVVYENWGLETAADANGPTLKEFSNIEGTVKISQSLEAINWSERAALYLLL